ncbi:MAG: membrane protein ORF65 [Parcubacteria group bacterium GW2011_GWF2_38_76]|nr:MAG: membrane protein ORF65 [Parcubacteria group bacterium GW2011_GWF2_38_76]HBM45740.1 hypothetical protein [Patescibacteria group bacterium]
MKKLGLGLIIALLVLIMVPVAQAVTQDVNISATVAQSLTFTVSDATIYFGTLGSGAAKYASTTEGGDTVAVPAHTMQAATNATGGYSIAVTGSTLTSGDDTITAIGATSVASSAGTEQFGVRLSSVSGGGTVATEYGTADEFAYLTTDQVASNATVTAADVYSATYIANIAALTEAGSYSTTLTYTATGSF